VPLYLLSFETSTLWGSLHSPATHARDCAGITPQAPKNKISILDLCGLTRPNRVTTIIVKKSGFLQETYSFENSRPFFNLMQRVKP
jgi:hypothetical protein